MNGHRHQPEIERDLRARRYRGERHVYAARRAARARDARRRLRDLRRSPSTRDAVHAAYARAYAGSPFVRVLSDGRAPSVAAVVGTNDAETARRRSGRVVRAICAIDNLGKGAAGQAIQNLNIMLRLSGGERTWHDRAVVA